MAEEFDALRYIASYPDLIQAFGADAEAGRQHWLTYGQAEGRNPFLFNPFIYGASHPDLIAAFGTNYAAYTTHYIQHGFAEGRATSSFDYLGYSASNEDLLVVYGTDPTALARHYLEFGHSEGRSFSRFDALTYAASNSDVAAAYGDDRAQILTHYINHGYYEHRPTSGFDYVEYVAANRDLLDFGYLNHPQDALYHYLQTGADEGRPTDFDERAYLLTYADLAGHHLSEGAALNHWINSGVHEGRVGDSLFGHDQTTHALPVGGTAVAAIDFANDRDWFELNLAQGAFHSLLTTNADGSVRPATITLHDQYGVPIASRIVKTGDVSGLDFTASYAGRYFVVVTSDQTGAYRLTDTENATGTMTIGGRNYTDADFAGVQGIRYLVLTDHYSVELGPNAQAAGIRVVTATSNLASVIDASAYTVGLTVDVSAGGGDTVITGSGNDHVIAGAGAQNISLGAGDDLVTGAVSTAHTISGGDGTDTIRVTGNVLLDLTKFSDVERIEQGDGKLWLRLTTSGPTADAHYTIVGNGSYEYNLVWLELELTQPNIDFTILAAPGGTQFYKANNGIANTIKFVGGEGFDNVQISITNLGPDGFIDGGGGVDWYFAEDILLVDADFAPVRNMEVLNVAPDEVTLGQVAAASGLTTINLETSRGKNIVFEADYTGAIEVTMTRTGFFSRETGDELSHVIDASLSPVQLTVSAWDS